MKDAEQTFENFDKEPDSAFVPEPVVLKVYKCDRSTIWRRVKEGKFPAPVKFGTRSNRWNVGELRRYSESLMGAA